MMIHEKIMSGQFLLDLKSDRSSLLNAHHHHHHHHHGHHHLQPPSPPMPALKMDIYSAYAYQQQLQQQLINGNQNHQQQQQQQQQQQLHHHHQSAFSAPPIAEVLDLSRRCDSLETPPRKTPSPYQTSSSFSTSSPAASPPSNIHRQQQPTDTAAPSIMPSNLLYAQKSQTAAFSLAASLYPTLYHSNAIKSEPISPPPAPQPIQTASPTTQLPPVAAATTSLLQTFANAAAVASSAVNVPTPNSPKIIRETNKPATPTRTVSLQQDANKTTTTRPFKAFPRDPLVIAANFAATDVLLDNPRVERYTEYRKRVLEQIRNSNGGSRTVTNPKMRRTNSRSGSIHEGSSSNNNSESDERNAAEESSDCDSNAGNFDKRNGNGVSLSTMTQNDIDNGGNTSGSQVKDAAYFERRRKNNAAAKKSRDRRRIKEDEIAIRAAYLERQNIELLCQIDALKAQLAAFASKAAN